MLLGAAVMRALMPDRDDNAGLVIVPAMGRNPGALAQLRPCAVGGDQEAHIDLGAVGQPHADAVGA